MTTTIRQRLTPDASPREIFAMLNGVGQVPSIRQGWIDFYWTPMQADIHARSATKTSWDAR